MTDPNVTSLYFATFLALTPPTEGFPWDYLRKITHGTTEVKGCLKHKMAKKYCRKFQPLRRALERYRRQTELTDLR